MKWNELTDKQKISCLHASYCLNGVLDQREINLCAAASIAENKSLYLKLKHELIQASKRPGFSFMEDHIEIIDAIHSA